MLHFKLSSAPGADARMAARISFSFFCASFGAAAMYSPTSFGLVFLTGMAGIVRQNYVILGSGHFVAIVCSSVGLKHV